MAFNITNFSADAYYHQLKITYKIMDELRDNYIYNLLVKISGDLNGLYSSLFLDNREGDYAWLKDIINKVHNEIDRLMDETERTIRIKEAKDA